MKTICVLLTVILAMSCGQPNATKLLGSWQIDSVYDYHNGFTFTNRNPYPREIHEYQSNNVLLRKGMGEQLEYHYTCKDSILTLNSAEGAALGETIIVHLDDEKLVLKEYLKSQFTSKNEVRYEMRYFSRVDSLK